MSRRRNHLCGASRTYYVLNESAACKGPQYASSTSSLPKDLIREDFANFGYTDDKTRRLFDLKEPYVDSCTQITHGRFANNKHEAERALETFKPKKELRRGTRGNPEDRTCGMKNDGSGSVSKRQQVYLDDQKKWVLFDPIRSWPPAMGVYAQQAYEKYSWYEPGNQRVVAYNVESSALSLRRAPNMLKGTEVVYQEAGPKLLRLDRGRKDEGKT